VGYEWCSAAIGTLHRPEETLALSLSDGGEYSAIAPMVLDRSQRAPWLRLITQGLINEPMDLLYRDGEALHELVGALLDLRYPVCLDRVDANSLVLDAVSRAKLPWHILRVRPPGGCPVIRLCDAWREPESCLSPHHRQSHRRALRKARQVGAVRMEVRAPTLAELPSLLETCYAVEAASWKGSERTALAQDPVRGPFFRRYAEMMVAQGMLRLALLYLDEQPVAMQIAVESHGGFWLLKIGYDQKFASCSPGHLLMHDTIAYAAGRQLSTYEFMGRIVPWTQHWTRDNRPCVYIELYPLSIASGAALAYKVAGRLRRVIGGTLRKERKG
jgi:hypothetical protein